MRRAPPHAATPDTVKLESDEFPCADLDVARVEGWERISDLYRFEVMLRPRDATAAVVLEPDEIVGARVRLSFSNHEGFSIRTVHGVVARARASLDGAGAAQGARPGIAYALEVVPSVSSLGLTRTQEIFMDMTIPEIIRAKIETMALDYVEFRCSGQYAKREFVVQYKETDLAFIRRLAEHVGLAFHFEFSDTTEKMVFSDHVAALPDFREERIDFGPREERLGVHQLGVTSRTIASLYAVQDYNYRNPRLDLGVVHELPCGGGGVIEYGTHHKTPEEADALAKARAEEALATSRVLSAEGIAGWLSAGGRFKLGHAPFAKDAGQDLIVVSVHHRMEAFEASREKQDVGYECSFEAVSAARPYRPPRITPKPRIDGILTAVVQADPTSPATEAQLDEEGRYVVQFHFDTADRGSQLASRRVRMAQPFAGPSQGMHFPLTPETEVIIAFVDGDPDRPIIVGALPNPVTPTHVTVADSHMHRIRSRHGLIVEFGKTVTPE